MPLLKTTKTVGGEITNKSGQISSALNFGSSDTQLLHLCRVQCLHVARPQFLLCCFFLIIKIIVFFLSDLKHKLTLISKTSESRQHMDTE